MLFKKYLPVALAIVFVFGLAFHSHFVEASTIPFGGAIVSPPKICLNGGVSFKVLGYIGGKPGTFSVIYRPGISRSYLFGPPKSPGQLLLGSSVPDATCILGIGIPDVSGLLIDSLPGHGSSLK